MPEIRFTQLLQTPLNQILKGLGDAKKVKTVKTTDTIAHLTGKMECFKIRTMPVLDANTGQLVGVVSLVDVAKVLTPRNTKLPIEYLSKKGFDMTQLHNANKEMGKKTVGEVFNFDLKPAFIVWTEVLEEAIKQLIHRDENGRRNRTLVILDAGDRVVGTFSYVDALRIIRDGTGIGGFLDERTANDVLTSKVITLTKIECLQDAMFTFGGLFTHIPITTVKDGKIVIGIVDDVAAATLEHELLYEDLCDYPLSQMMTKVSDKNTVKPNCSIKTLIGKFVDGHERPTAILVGDYEGEEFTMTGIISYVDIFKKLLDFIDGLNNQQPGNN
ncbi:CBS domain-containing protein [Microcoleus sp. PH2017_05_CCC_O_A]|uniref:CBS domain-containing protein n=1 Tax=Microcoleus sp. PH2017_05_CCC_O_A TaxID=2798816 RepID=UPI001DA4A1B1|nr:CBS domain-containing protein [Microcoleus sp. PH2017_05_CCC_O_A]MCC3439119.1 CBS domain-containing protein [Microcoleus sp. PH2017_05_CCC_O_A]